MSSIVKMTKTTKADTVRKLTDESDAIRTVRRFLSARRAHGKRLPKKAEGWQTADGVVTHGVAPIRRLVEDI